MLFLILTFAFLAGVLPALAISSLLGAERRTLAARLAALPRRQDDVDVFAQWTAYPQSFQQLFAELTEDC